RSRWTHENSSIFTTTAELGLSHVWSRSAPDVVCDYPRSKERGPVELHSVFSAETADGSPLALRLALADDQSQSRGLLKGWWKGKLGQIGGTSGCAAVKAGFSSRRFSF